jgi:hypothetical protein
VSAHAVVELLKGKNYDVEEKDVRIETPIKSVGAHAVKVHVHGDRYAELSIEVKSESGVTAPPAVASPAPEAAAESAAESAAD